jgi:hypothetical protein
MGQDFKIPYEDGSVYTGQCLKDKPHGKGKLTYANGNVFDGMFELGDPRDGSLTFANGDKYVGQLRDGRFNGKGSFKGSTVNEEGIFEDGKLVDGTIHYENGDKY